jgi:hypothetical protein
MVRVSRLLPALGPLLPRVDAKQVLTSPLRCLNPDRPHRQFPRLASSSTTRIDMVGTLLNMPALEESMTKVAIRNRKRRANRAAERDDNAAPAHPQLKGPNNARNRKQKEKRKATRKKYKEREIKELQDLPASRETTPQPPSRKRPREMAAQQPREPDHLVRETTTDVIARKRAREMVSPEDHASGPDWRETIGPSLRKHLDYGFSTKAFLSGPATGPSREHGSQDAQSVLQHRPRVAIDRNTGLPRAMPLNHRHISPDSRHVQKL